MISRKQTVCSIKNMLQNFRGKDKEIAAEISKKKYKKNVAMSFLSELIILAIVSTNLPLKL